MPPQTNLEQSIDIIQNRLSAVVLSYMQTAGKRLKDISEIEDLQTYLYSAEFLDDTGKDLRKVQRELNKTHKQNLHDINSLFKTVTAEAYSTGKEMAERKDTRLSPLASYRQEASPLLRQVVRDYDTMSRSTTLNSDYKKTIRQYVNRLTMGGEDNAPTAMRKAIRELTAQGISTIDYQSGRSMRMDTAVRRDLMGEFTQIVQNIQNKVGQEIGADGWEISAHEHAAIDHIDIQGHTFTNAEFEKLQNGEDAEDIEGNVYQTDRPIGMWNCRHLFFPVLIGISEPSFTNEQLEAMQDRNEDGIDFDGKHYTLYEAEQQQRQLETAMRRERENLNLYKEVRETSPQAEHDYQKSKARLAELRNEYKELGAALEPKAIRMKLERASVPRGSTGGKSFTVNIGSTDGKSTDLSGTPNISSGLPASVEKSLGITRGNPIDIETAYKGANPNYGDPDYRFNCQRCVPAYELRRRGYDVEALGSTVRTHTGDQIIGGFECFEGSVVTGRQNLYGDGTKLTKASLNQQLNDLPDGARGGILIAYNKSNNGHVFAFEKVDGVVKFYDPQKGQEASGTLEQAGRGQYAYYRMDNLPLSTKIDWTHVVRGRK